jgi:CPA2 family monovalent cation:H+ antiporter-2
MMSESALSQRAAEESLPLRDAFAVLFFVSIGMLFDPGVVVRDFFPLLATVVVILLGNGGIAFAVIRLYRYPLATALTVGAGLAQIGEFSFILIDLGLRLEILEQRGRDLILGASIASIFVNPALFWVFEKVRARFGPRPLIEEPAAEPAQPDPEIGLIPTTLADHAILVGYGRVGQLVGARLIEDGWPLLVIEDAADIIEQLRQEGVEVIAGNAAEDYVLAAVNLEKARVLIVAIPNGFEAGQIVEQARVTNPDLHIIARAHFDAEVEHLTEHGANTVIMGEREIARSIIAHTSQLPRVHSHATAEPTMETA